MRGSRRRAERHPDGDRPHGLRLAAGRRLTVSAVAIVVAAGAGERLGADVPKAFVELGGESLLARSVRAALASSTVSSVVVAVPAGSEEAARALIADASVVIVVGGETRHASVRAALDAVPSEADVVVVHDAARPFATPALFDAVVQAIGDADGAVPALTPADTVKRVRDGWVVSTESREELRITQTPQAFRSSALRAAHERADGCADERARAFTDDAAVLEWAGFRVKVIEGEPDNFKVTTVADLDRAAMIAERARG